MHGYDEAMSAAHPDKFNGVNDFDLNALKNSGKKYLMEVPQGTEATSLMKAAHRFAYVFKRGGDGGIIPELQPMGRSDNAQGT